MLRRVVAALAVILTAILTTPATAGESVVCPPGGTVCYVVIDLPPTPGTEPVSSSGNSSAPACHAPGSAAAVPCYDSVFGWWSNADGCYYQRLQPQPPAADPAWEGHYPDGVIYQATCPGTPGTGGGWTWRPTAPAGFGGGPGAVAQLASEAIARLSLRGPDIGLAPDQSKTGLVGLPVWMWTTVGPSTWGPASATASLPGLSVTATARATRIDWSMGDGQTVTCNGPGTPYRRTSGQTHSPTCGYVYDQSSAGQPGDRYTVTATTTWQINWAGNGQSGSSTQSRTSSTRVRIGELQVLVS